MRWMPKKVGGQESRLRVGEVVRSKLESICTQELVSCKSWNYDNTHCALFAMNACRSARRDWRSFQASSRCSSHVSRIDMSSKFSARPRSKCNSRSRASRVVRVTSIKSVSSRERLRCVAAGRN